MTTVGYGNQAPVTETGRLIVGVAGFFSLLAFAIVLGMSGFVIIAISEDLLSRTLIARYLKHHSVEALVWGLIWGCWAWWISFETRTWWDDMLPDFGSDVTEGDTMWFAFISSSTIGLGDYFLQPEVMFADYALRFSVYFLIAFVFLTTFLGKIADMLFHNVPQDGDGLDLKSRLERTNVFCWDFCPCSKKDLLVVDASNVKGDDEHDDNDMSLLEERVKLLRNLLKETPNKLEVRGGDAELIMQEEEDILRSMLSLHQSKDD